MVIHLRNLGSLFALTLLWGLAHASSSASLAPYRAVYETSWSYGLPIPGEAVRELRQDGGDRWQLVLEANASGLAKQHESSLVQLKADQVTPLSYTYRRKVLGRKREAQLRFDWQRNQVLNRVQGQGWRMALEPKVQDHLSYQLQMRLDLMAGKRELAYQIADGGHLKTYRFRVEGEERLRTPLGEFDTLRLERVRDPDNPRETLLWVAPQLDYLIVKLSQKEKDGEEYELTIQTLDALPAS